MGPGCAAQMGMGFPSRICIFAAPAAGCLRLAPAGHTGRCPEVLPPAPFAFLHFLIARSQRTPPLGGCFDGRFSPGSKETRMPRPLPVGFHIRAASQLGSMADCCCAPPVVCGSALVGSIFSWDQEASVCSQGHGSLLAVARCPQHPAHQSSPPASSAAHPWGGHLQLHGCHVVHGKLPPPWPEACPNQ